MTRTSGIQSTRIPFETARAGARDVIGGACGILLAGRGDDTTQNVHETALAPPISLHIPEIVSMLDATLFARVTIDRSNTNSFDNSHGIRPLPWSAGPDLREARSGKMKPTCFSGVSLSPGRFAFGRRGHIFFHSAHASTRGKKTHPIRPVDAPCRRHVVETRATPRR